MAGGVVSVALRPTASPEVEGAETERPGEPETTTQAVGVEAIASRLPRRPFREIPEWAVLAPKEISMSLTHLPRSTVVQREARLAPTAARVLRVVRASGEGPVAVLAEV